LKMSMLMTQEPRLGPTRLVVRILDDLYMHIPSSPSTADNFVQRSSRQLTYIRSLIKQANMTNVQGD
jgi:hypothetical protein